MTRPITVGVDGSAESLAAAEWAAREASLRRTPLRIVHAWLWHPLEVGVVQDRDIQAKAAEGVLREAKFRVAAHCPDVEITAEVVSDTVVAALLAEAGRAEMTVLGSRGHGAFTGFLLGSYGQQVIASAKRPVVSVRAVEAVGSAGRSGEVVVGQQGGAEDCDAVLEFAFRAAAVHGAAVRAVRAWALPPFHTVMRTEAMRRFDEAGGLEPYEREALTEALLPWRKAFPDVPVTEHVEIGGAGEVLLSASAEAQLLVVGRRVRRSAVGMRIGSVAHAALHHARCPVAVVPHA
ncbi:universal stress protein [Streptomyces sp. HNM0663]|uniref:Universal stress protein n=1 Tax=Streptomyces chengmaiensis TaxID=3040919 RepID=A0ABT6HGN5_9ACTN|nr:universal stress protein [Streptomyces chengmaiensis]MDH2387929.1 universal stress protein [Streptomyces chengmaiensis]